MSYSSGPPLVENGKSLIELQAAGKVKVVMQEIGKLSYTVLFYQSCETKSLLYLLVD